VNLNGLLYVVACVCFFVALLVALGVNGVSNWQAWAVGGLLAWALSGGLTVWRPGP
jgi:hypothetical protein